jgi:hypothetical protein
MPQRCDLDPRLPGLLLAQDHTVHRHQALEYGYTARAITHRLDSGQWHVVLPKVYLTAPTEPSRRQMLIAALLFVGPDGAIDGVDSCRFHGLRSVAIDEATVHVVAPWGQPARSRGFVVVRRTRSPILTTDTDRLRYVDAATAAIVAARGVRRERAATAVVSEALQRRVTTYEELVRAHVQGPPRGARLVGRAIEALATGAASVPEVDFLDLVAISAILPLPLCNILLRLPCGRLISPDALFLSSGVVHETNGRRAHERADLFADMQERHDAMTAAGLIVLHNPPSRLLRQPREVLSEVERCHQRYDGRGLPAGVTLVAGAA